MNLYRDKIELDSGSVIPAKVYVLSTEAEASRGGPIESVTAVVTVPASQRAKILTTFRSFDWRGATFYRQGMVIPIVALGRVDHYEIRATSDTAPE